jgi:nicotinic acid phosphoribosyltransferase
MSNWLYQNKVIDKIEDFPEGCFGFVYKITNLQTNQFYIGKKFLTHKKTKKLGKKALLTQTGPGRKKTKEITFSESDWKTYWGSCKPLLEDVKTLGEHLFYKEILEFAFTSKHLSYLEAKHQFVSECLETNNYNDNIQGRYFKKDFYPQPSLIIL